MKKTLLILCILLCLVLSTACGSTNDSEQNDQSSEDHNSELQFEDTSYTVYPQKTKLIFSKSDGLYNYYVFKIGEVARVPLAYYTSEYHSGLTDTQYNWSNITVSSSTVSNTEAELREYTISSEIGSSIKSGFESSVGASDLGISASIKASLESELTSKISSESKITNSTENRQEIAKVQENRSEKTITIDKNSPKGHYWYAICTSCDIYVALACNTSSKTFTYDFITTSVGEKYDAMLYSGERDRLDPNITEKLNFDPSVFNGMDIFGELDNSIKSVEINLEEYIDTSKATCSLTKDFNGKGYSYSAASKVLTLHGTEDYTDIQKFKIIGNYGKKDSKGSIIETVINGLSIQISSVHDIIIELECVAFNSANYSPAVSANKSEDGINITLISSGLDHGNKLIQSKGSALLCPVSCSPILDCSKQNITIKGNVPLLITPDEQCNTGSDGIAANKLVIDFDSYLTVYGAHGINGSNGEAVSDDNDGKPGGNGKDGGNAINVMSLDIKKCYSLKLYGGAGGDGGNGSAGDNRDFNPLGTATPRKGGNGGNGGNGGCGIFVFEVTDLKDMISNVEIFVCHGGDGGAGGNGGAGGGKNNVGRGGNGGDGGYGGYACCSNSGDTTYFEAYNGKGGSGGAGGCNSNDTSKNGSAGQNR